MLTDWWPFRRRWEEIKMLLSRSHRKIIKWTVRTNVKSDSKLSRRDVLWAKQDHISKISIKISHSKDVSLERSDWIPPLFALMLSSSLVHHPTPLSSFHYHSFTFSPHPSFSLCIHQSATMNRSTKLPLSYVTLFFPSPPQPTQSPSPSLLSALSLPLCLFFLLITLTTSTLTWCSIKA